MAKGKRGKERIIEAAVRLVATQGSGAATVRAITESAGVTEAALYRHFRSKDELFQAVYDSIIADMVVEKERIVTGPGTVKEKLAEWVRVSYAHYDRYPDQFTFVLLVPLDLRHDHPPGSRSQGEMLLALLRASQARGESRLIDPEIALSHMIGIMLNIPRRINQKILVGPAMQYAQEVGEAIWRVLKP